MTRKKETIRMVGFRQALLALVVTIAVAVFLCIYCYRYAYTQGVFDTCEGVGGKIYGFGVDDLWCVLPTVNSPDLLMYDFNGA